MLNLLKKLIAVSAYYRSDKPLFHRINIQVVLFQTICLCYGWMGNCHRYMLFHIEPTYPGSRPYKLKDGTRANPSWFMFSFYDNRKGFMGDCDNFVLHVSPFRFDWEWALLARKFGTWNEGGDYGPPDGYYTWYSPWYLRVLGATKQQMWL